MNWCQPLKRMAKRVGFLAGKPCLGCGQLTFDISFQIC
jgi:hypothetical protein